MKNRIKNDIQKILNILSEIEKTNKDPQIGIYLRRVRRELNMPLPQLCEDCGTELHERDGHYCLNGEWK